MAVEFGAAQTENNENSVQEAAAELGDKLRKLREAQGLTFEDVRAAIKIQKKYIEAIEEGRTEIIPKGPFCRSFIKQYCEYLKADDLWARYDPLLKSINSTKSASNGEEIVRSGVERETAYRRRPLLRIFIFAVMLLSIAAAAWVTLRYRGEIAKDATTPLDGGTAAVIEDASKDVSAEILPSLDKAPASPGSSIDLGWMDGKEPAAKASDNAEQQGLPAAQPAGQGSAAVPELTVRADGVIWIKFSTGNKVLFEGLMKKDEVRSFSPDGTEPLRVRYGNPAKTLISWGGGAEARAGTAAKPMTKYYRSDGTVSDTK
ncbi:MAG: DUF4115 domain-containing protein [Synergistes sp.]|nr:DUF4115 domain-containing protein [Synergistes sp.]